MKKIPALKDANSGLLIHDPKKLPSNLNKHFASCAATLAAKLLHSERHFSEFLAYRPKTFYFLPVTPGEVESEISLLPLGKSHGVYSCPVSFLKVSKCFISQPPTDIMNTSILEGRFLSSKMETIPIPTIIAPYHCCPFSIEFLKDLCTNV